LAQSPGSDDGGGLSRWPEAPGSQARVRKEFKAEAGILDGDRYIEQLFASKADVRAFRLILRDADGEKWLNDRHFTALKKLGCAELDAVTYAGIASFFDPAQ
jgi:hypothetical protein